MASENISKTVLVTGATGLLGRSVVMQLENWQPSWKVIRTGKGRASPPVIPLDLTDYPHMQKFVQEQKPDILIHCAAERRPDVAANDPDAVYELNVSASKRLAIETAKLGIPMIYISTDYVFDGTKPPYEPEDETNPTNQYGISKRDGEVEVLRANQRATVLRIPALYGEIEHTSESPINVLLDVVLNVSRESNVPMDNWQIRYPTNTSDVARVLVDLSSRMLSGTVPAVLHFSATQKFTKYEICKIFGEILGVPITHLKRVDTDAGANHGVIRPHDCFLSSKKLAELGIDVRTVDFVEWWRRKLLPTRR